MKQFQCPDKELIVAKCFCCKVDNACLEVVKHVSVTSIQSLKHALEQYNEAPLDKLVPGLMGCKNGHAAEGAVFEWQDNVNKRLANIRRLVQLDQQQKLMRKIYAFKPR